MAEEKGQSTVSEPMKLEGTEEGGKSVTETDTAELLAILDKLNVKSPGQIEGMHTASRQSGHMAQLLGEERQARQRLEQEVAELRSQQPRRQPAYHHPEDDLYGQGSHVDLQALIETTQDRTTRRVFREEFENLVLKPQQQVREQFQRDIKFIRTHRLYPMVENEWKDHQNDFDVQERLQTGQTTLAQEFMDFAIDRVTNAAMQMKNVYERDVIGKTKPDTKPPHIESTTGESPLPTEESGYAQSLADVTSRWSGTDRDLERLMKTVLPDDDKILGYGVEAAPIPESKVGKKRKRT